MIVALFEDEKYTNFLPLTYTRPVFECRSGIFTFLERAQKMYSKYHFLLFTRDYLVPTLKKRVSCPINKPNSIDDDVLLINGTLIIDEETKRLISKKLGKNVLITQQERIALAHINEETAKKHGEEFCKPFSHRILTKLVKKCKTL
ncbi:hypothetical protein DRO69_08045, partial [Candidatus Bathyarchaeota archaeon]